MKPKMFQMSIPSWEIGQHDYPQILFFTGELDDIHFYLHLCKMYSAFDANKPGNGNIYLHKDIIESRIRNAIIECNPSATITSAIANSYAYTWLCENVLGWPSSGCTDQGSQDEMLFCRAVDLDSIRIYELEPDKKNLLEEFLESSGYYWS